MIRKAFLTNSIGTLCSRVFGLVRDLCMASFLGAGILSDIFFVAFKFPNLCRRIFAEGAFAQSFLPNFIQARKKGAFSVLVFGIFFSIILLLSLFVWQFSGLVTKALANGFSQENIVYGCCSLFSWSLLERVQIAGRVKRISKDSYISNFERVLFVCHAKVPRYLDGKIKYRFDLQNKLFDKHTLKYEEIC